MGIIQSLEESALASALIIFGAVTISLGMYAYFAHINHIDCDSHYDHDHKRKHCNKWLHKTKGAQIALIAAGGVAILVGIAVVFWIPFESKLPS